MGNKEKHIEYIEMAREIHEAQLHCINNSYCHNCEFRNDTPMGFCKAEYIAKAISEKYQPKLPEDSIINTPTIQCETYSNGDMIVIPREEYERLKLEVAIEKKRADESYTQKEVEEIIASKERIKSKETAREFYDKFNENICCFKLENKSEDYKDGYAQAIADICGKLDKTAIYLGVDLKEYYGK